MLRRIRAGVSITGRPHTRHQWDSEVVHEVVAVVPAFEELSPGEIGRHGAIEQFASSSMKTRHLEEHPQESRLEESCGLGSDPAESTTAGVLQPALRAVDAHAHLGGLGLDPELPEDAQQVGIRALVVHDEPGVHVPCPAIRSGDRVGVGMTPEAIVRLEQRDRVRVAKRVGGNQTGNPGTHDCCGRPHRNTSVQPLSNVVQV